MAEYKGFTIPYKTDLLSTSGHYRLAYTWAPIPGVLDDQGFSVYESTYKIIYIPFKLVVSTKTVSGKSTAYRLFKEFAAA